VTLPSLLDLIADRETAASAAAKQLREHVTELTAQLAVVEAELADLATTRTTLAKLAGGDTQAPTTVDATITSPAYQNILAVFDTHPTGTANGLRAKDVCLTLGLDITPKHTEGARAKLKRLVARGVLTETEPGLFALTPTPSA
jgi:hypothetical protein